MQYLPEPVRVPGEVVARFGREQAGIGRCSSHRGSTRS
jgi:hypothetical protein